MFNSSLETQVRYVTNAAGKTTDVLVPLELWQYDIDLPCFEFLGDFPTLS